MIAKLESDSVSHGKLPEACRSACLLEQAPFEEVATTVPASDERSWSEIASISSLFSAIPTPSSSPRAFHDANTDDMPDNEDNTNMLLHETCDSSRCEAIGIASVSVSASSIPSFSHLMNVSLSDGSDQDETTMMLFNWSCEAELKQAMRRLMSSESVGPFLEDQLDTVLGLCTIEQRLTDGMYMDAGNRKSVKLFWSDIDDCLVICESSGRLPFLVWEMRTLAKQLEEDFWNFRHAYGTALFTMDPFLRPIAALAFVFGSNLENWVDFDEWGDFSQRMEELHEYLDVVANGSATDADDDDLTYGYASATDSLVDTPVTSTGDIAFATDTKRLTRR